MPIKQQIITPGQGLLLLIKHYQDDPIKLRALKSLYINGANNGEHCIELCDALLQDPVLKAHDIVIDELSINSDPTRRYFETHLAYHTLKNQLGLLSEDALNLLYLSAFGLFYQKIPPEKLCIVQQVVKGQLVRPTFHKRENYQYHFYIQRILEGSIFSEFSQIERDKILHLVRLLYVALVNGWQKTDMPIDIYDTERFSSRARGRIKRDMNDLGLMRNQNFGLLKGYMPLAPNDIAKSLTPFEHIKSGDYGSFDVDSPVVQACFQQLVHSFSNSISGSFLVFLRVLGRLHSQQQSGDFTTSIDKLMLLLQLSISSALYYSGGHSLYEYMAILNMPEVQDFFQFLPGFAELDLGKIFYESSEAAFNEALKETIEYNDKLMAKKILHAELLTFFKPEDEKNSVSEEAFVAHMAVPP